MKVVGGDFYVKTQCWALSDRFVFGDKIKGEPIQYIHVEGAELQEETKKGFLVSIRFLDGRRLLALLTEDEYLQLRGAMFEADGDIEARRTEAIAQADHFKRQQEQRLIKERRVKQVVLIAVIGAVAYAMLKPSDQEGILQASTDAAPTSESESLQSSSVSSESKPTPAQPRGIILDGAVQRVTQDQYPKAYKKWGKSGVDRINNLAPQAAQLVVESGSCDQLEVIDISDRGTPPDNIVFFADCTNGKRFYVSEEDIRSKSAIVAKDDQTARYEDGVMVEMCTNAVRSSLQFPSTFNATFGGTTVYRAPKGNVAVNIDFVAKNGLGNELPHSGRCVFDDRGMSPPEISPR